MAETLKLCVSCRGCRRECPTGVDMAKMKIEVQAARAEKYGLSLHDRLVGYLPRCTVCGEGAVATNLCAPRAPRSCRGRCGFQCRLSLPRARCAPRPCPGGENGREVALFADTFSRYFEREIWMLRWRC